MVHLGHIRVMLREIRVFGELLRIHLQEFRIALDWQMRFVKPNRHEEWLLFVAFVGEPVDGFSHNNLGGKIIGRADLDSIADLQMLTTLLSQRGYSRDDIERIFWKNFVEFLRRAWA